MSELDEFHVVRDTFVGRNDDLANLFSTDLFRESSNLNIFNGKRLVVDVGVGGLPVASCSLAKLLIGKNVGIKFVGTELPGVSAKAHLVIDKDLFKQFLDKNSFNVSEFRADWKNSMILGVRLVVNKDGDINEVLVNFKDSRSPDGFWNTLVARKKLRGRQNDSANPVLIDKLVNFLGSTERINSVATERFPAQNAFKSVGGEYVETDNLAGSGVVDADLIMASHVVMHLKDVERDGFLRNIFFALKEGGIFVAKNRTSRGFVVADVMRKEENNLVLVSGYKASFLSLDKSFFVPLNQDCTIMFGDIGGVVYAGE